MHRKLALILCIYFLGICNTHAANGNRWEMIKAGLAAANSGSSGELKTYLASLDLQELLEAGREASDEAQTICPECIFCESTTYFLAFFWETYPAKDGLKSFEPLLQEIRKKENSNFWRASLIEMLADHEWVKQLTSEQIFAICEEVNPILANQSEHSRLRYEACRNLQTNLHLLEERAIVEESALTGSAKNYTTIAAVKSAMDIGEVSPSTEFTNKCEVIFNMYNTYAKTLSAVLIEQKRVQILDRGVLQASEACLKIPIASNSILNEALSHLIQDYVNVDEKNWTMLIRIDRENLNDKNWSLLGRQMLESIKERHATESETNKRKRFLEVISPIEEQLKTH